jgi:hypothetical protein
MNQQELNMLNPLLLHPFARHATLTLGERIRFEQAVVLNNMLALLDHPLAKKIVLSRKICFSFAQTERTYDNIMTHVDHAITLDANGWVQTKANIKQYYNGLLFQVEPELRPHIQAQTIAFSDEPTTLCGQIFAFLENYHRTFHLTDKLDESEQGDYHSIESPLSSDIYFALVSIAVRVSIAGYARADFLAVMDKLIYDESWIANKDVVELFIDHYMTMLEYVDKEDIFWVACNEDKVIEIAFSPEDGLGYAYLLDPLYAQKDCQLIGRYAYKHDDDLTLITDIDALYELDWRDPKDRAIEPEYFHRLWEFE